MFSNAYDFLSKGGVLIWPILAGSVLALSVFLERLWSLRRKYVLGRGLSDEAFRAIRKGDPDQALVLCRESETALGELLAVALERWKVGQDPREAVEERGKSIASYLERYVVVLEVIAAIEPLLGLLGTVLGMIKVFHNVSQSATAAGVDVALLANGIWEALITTAAGLSVAIPTYVGYRYIQSRVDRLLTELEDTTVEFVELLEQRADRAPSTPAQTEDSEATQEEAQA